MITQDQDLAESAGVAREYITLRPVNVAASAAGTKIAAVKPGYAFEIVGVQHFVGTVTATASYDVKIGTTSALSAAAVPVAATRGDAALGATTAARKGTADDEINLHATTDASGALSDVQVIVVIRPQGLRHGY